jgi:anti-sigma B factor antagonist
MQPLLGPVTVIERGPGRFTITGEIDLATARQLYELQDIHGPLLLDLHGVTFMDSSGIRALIQLTRRCPHGDCTLRIEACSLPVERVLRIAGVYEILTADGAPHRSNGDGHNTNPLPPAPTKEPGAATAT